MADIISNQSENLALCTFLQEEDRSIFALNNVYFVIIDGIS